MLITPTPPTLPMPPTRPTVPLLRLGFRPFYLLAALFAALSVPLWLASYTGRWTGLPNVGLLWHMHEMVFGFGMAVVVGFLFTAVRNWTGLWTPHGTRLALIAALWLAGRLAMLAGPPLAAALVDLLFLPVAIVPLYLLIQRSGNHRNLPLLGLLALMALANAAFHASALGWLALSPMRPVEAAILLLTLLATVIGGRVLPGFTVNTIGGAKPAVKPRRDMAGVAALAAAALAWTVDAPGPLTAALATTAAVLHLLRLGAWSSLRAAAHPLLWILQLGYAWIAAGLLLLAAAALGWAGASSAFHALAIGAIGSLMLGMLCRTTLGHTGRPIRAGRREHVMFLALQLGALSRVGANLCPPSWREALLLLSGVSWSLAFLLNLIFYAPSLWRARCDGREG